MEPLSPNDPLWNLLGQAKPAEPRPNFAQNVVRAARQTPQERGWFARLRGWWREAPLAGGLAWAAAAVALAATALWVHEPAGAPAVTASKPAAVESAAAEADFPLVPGFETEWENLEQMGDLLVVNDTSLLTDSEIHLLLY